MFVTFLSRKRQKMSLHTEQKIKGLPTPAQAGVLISIFVSHYSLLKDPRLRGDGTDGYRDCFIV